MFSRVGRTSRQYILPQVLKISNSSMLLYSGPTPSFTVMRLSDGILFIKNSQLLTTSVASFLLDNPLQPALSSFTYSVKTSYSSLISAGNKRKKTKNRERNLKWLG